MPSHSRNEGFYQKSFMADAKVVGCHVVRLASFMKAGILDLYVKHLAFPGVWTELKAVDWPAKANTPIKITTTELQNVFIENCKRAGGKAAVVVFFDHPEMGRGCFTHLNPHIVRSLRQDQVLSRAHWRQKGKGWPIEAILQEACGLRGTIEETH